VCLSSLFLDFPGAVSLPGFRICRFPAVLSLVIQDRLFTLGAILPPKPIVAARIPAVAGFGVKLNDTCLKGAYQLIPRRLPFCVRIPVIVIGRTGRR
jgi:hypothetical protein